jgi:potassium efflux system protein
VFRRGGLADAHFRWPAEAVRAVRRVARWLVPVATVAAALLAVSDAIGTDESAATLGRLAFSLFWLVLAIAFMVLARPGGTVSSLVAKRGGWAERTRYLWLPLVPLAPIVIVVLAWLGYFYTARQFAGRFAATLAIAGAIVLVNGLLTRWLFVARRRVAVEDAKRRREQTLAEQAEGELPTEGVQAAIDEDKLDLPAISQQTQQLFRAGLLVAAVLGLYAAWAGTLPALRVLDRVQVFPSLEVAEGADTETVPILEGTPIPSRTAQDAGAAASGAPSPASNGSSAGEPGGRDPVSPSLSPALPVLEDAEPDQRSPVVSLSDLLLAGGLLIATLVAFRNLPGFVEIFVLQRLPLDAGSRYALSTVLRYCIAIIGIAAAFGAVDIGWRNIQWLAAALTFGLAFGLQEIFANFVSGLIILAERPIRIGDTVTIGSVSGTVTRIRMRATTITDWERKELVIPNKSFITGEVINWTLSDPVLRVSVLVGVSYGADVRKAERVLTEIARATPDVLTDPKPYVYFKGFGDSTLDFDLRVFLPHVDYWVRVRHDLHMRITEAFRAEGIEIAFPQRDLHIRSAPGLEGLAPPPTRPRGAGGDAS